MPVPVLELPRGSAIEPLHSALVVPHLLSEATLLWTGGSLHLQLLLLRRRQRQLSLISVWAFRRSQIFLGTLLQLHCDCTSTEVPCSPLLIDNGAASTLQPGDYTSELRETPGPPGGCTGFTGPLPFPTHHTKYFNTGEMGFSGFHTHVYPYTPVPATRGLSAAAARHMHTHPLLSYSYVNKGAVIPMTLLTTPRLIVLVYLD